MMGGFLVENIRTEKSCAALVPTLDGGKCASHRLLRVCMWYQHYGNSPLMMAIDEGMVAVAALMVEKGANLAKGCTVRVHFTKGLHGSAEGLGFVAHVPVLCVP